MSICRCPAASIMCVYIYMCRWGSTSKTKRRQVGLCKCEVADLNMQVEINFAKAPTISNGFSQFSLRAAGQRGLMPTKHNPLEMAILKN